MKAIPNPRYPWKVDQRVHADKKRQRRAKVADKALRQVRLIKWRILLEVTA